VREYLTLKGARGKVSFDSLKAKYASKLSCYASLEAYLSHLTFKITNTLFNFLSDKYASREASLDNCEAYCICNFVSQMILDLGPLLQCWMVSWEGTWAVSANYPEIQDQIPWRSTWAGTLSDPYLGSPLSRHSDGAQKQVPKLPHWLPKGGVTKQSACYGHAFHVGVPGQVAWVSPWANTLRETLGSVHWKASWTRTLKKSQGRYTVPKDFRVEDHSRLNG
jgi:hypothetical protein